MMSTTIGRIAVIVLAAWGLPAGGTAAGAEWDVPKDPSKFHLFIFLGQSNMAGGFRDSHLYDDNGRYDPVTKPVPRVLQWRARQWRPAAHPLTKHNKLSFSIPLPFAQKYLREIADPEVKVGLVISAFGGKAIDNFTRGGRFYPSPQMLRSLKSQGRFKGIIWHQGEADTTKVYRFVTYERKLHSVVADIRSDLEMPGLPFITGQLAGQASNRDPNREYWSEAVGVVTRALADIGDHVPRAAHVRSTGASVCREHIRRLVDANGIPTGRTMRMRSDPVHFNRAGYTTMAERYVDAVLDRPAFKNDPVRIVVVPGRGFSRSLVREVSDLSGTGLRFSCRGAPEWLPAAPDGAISGTAPAPGTTACTVSVTDDSGAVDTVRLLVIARKPAPPAFAPGPFARGGAIVGRCWRDRVRFDRVRAWSSEVSEPDGDAVTFSKAAGPAWVKVSPDGTLSGTPPAADAGRTVSFAVRATDADGSARGEYRLEVLPDSTVWVERFDYYPDIRCEAVGRLLHLDANSPRETWFVVHGGFPVDKPKQYTDLRTSLYGQWFKFSPGTVCARAIVLDAGRFAGRAGRYRFRMNLGGVSPADAHFFVSIYEVRTPPGGAGECLIELENRSAASRGRPAGVTTTGRAVAKKLAEGHFPGADAGAGGLKEVRFDYGGAGDVLLVFSACRSSAARGGGSQFDDLSIERVGPEGR